MAITKDYSSNSEIYLNNWFSKNTTAINWTKKIALMKFKKVSPANIQPKKKTDADDLNQTILEIIREKIEAHYYNFHHYTLKDSWQDNIFHLNQALKNVFRMPHYAFCHLSALPTKIKYWSLAFTISLIVLSLTLIASVGWSGYLNRQVSRELVLSSQNQKVVLGAQDKNLFNNLKNWWQQNFGLK